jgi:hypothetical protein
MPNPNIAEAGKAYRFKPGNPGGGRKPDPWKAAIEATMTEDDRRQIIMVAMSQAKAGDAVARQWLADREGGKAVARQEQGEPGEFDRLQVKLKVVDAPHRAG